MNIVVLYICPVDIFGPEHYARAVAFAQTLYRYPAGFPHRLVVVSNGGTPDTKTEALFAGAGAEFFERACVAKDIGAYQQCAREIPCDLMVFLGGSTYIRGANWLLPVVRSFRRRGPGIYGSMVNCGDERFNVSPHVRTTGFWMPPALLNRYPIQVMHEHERYPFEHGPECLTTWVSKQKLGCWAVTWTSEYQLSDWTKIPDGFHRSQQEGLIFGDHLSRPPHYPHP